MKQVILLIGLILPNLCFSQIDKSKILSKTNREFLSNFANRKSAEYYENYNEAVRVAKEKGWDTLNLVRINEQGLPEYLEPTNGFAANVSNTNQVNGGISGNLQGSGFIIGIWEATEESTGGNIPRVTHENLNTVNILDGSSVASNHATHVSGTLAGNGSGSSANAGQARGMAPAANLNAYNSSNDIAEMAVAATNGMLISNHSYGTRSGWRTSDWRWFGESPFNSTTEDLKFGVYNQDAASWDTIAFNAPFYTIFKSAGNDRNDNPINGMTQVTSNGTSYVTYDNTLHPPGDGIGYDNIPTTGNAKNIITVGAIDGQLANQVTSYSGWGPSDDGRIKPDIVTHGGESSNLGGLPLISSGANSDTHYFQSTGTSMASPVAAGSALLLQEHYEDLFGTGNFMRSATLKGLIIHTATDLGNPGPDYQFGWGLMNTLAAVTLLTDVSNDQNASIIEQTATGPQQNYGLMFNYGGSLKATLCYTDPAGVAQSTLDNTTPNLVNDLDISVGTIMPFVLNPSSPAANATTGDNDIDNVEQINFSLAGPVHILEVDNEGTITNGSQDYSLIISGNSNFEGVCEVVTNQGNISIDDGRYCNTAQINTEAIINNKTTKHRSMDRIVLKPGFRCINGASSKFEVLSGYVY